MKPLLHFAHGNGFPSPCYRQLFLAFEPYYSIKSIEKIGHNAKYPVTENWHLLVDEVKDSICQQSEGPVIAVGHSLGGVLSAQVALENPRLIRALVVIDAPMIGLVKSLMVRLAKGLGIIDRVTPAHRTRGRRRHWQTREQVLAYLSEKPLFQNFQRECLEDYVDYGLHKTADGYELAFERHIEYQIYRTIPHTMYSQIQTLDMPSLLIYGNKSNVVSRSDARYMERNYGFETLAIPGGHMLPMQVPDALAGAMREWLSSL